MERRRWSVIVDAPASRFAGTNQFALDGVDLWLVFGTVAKPGEEEDCPSHSDETENPERALPIAAEQRQAADDCGRKRSAESARQPDEALRRRAFMEWKPPAQSAGDVRIGSRFTDAEQEPDGYHRDQPLFGTGLG